MKMSCVTIPSPVGKLLLTADESALTGVHFADRDVSAARRNGATDAGHPILKKAAQQLAEYFAGKRTAFSIPWRLAGTTFQEKIWQEIARIPYGKTISYSELAARAGSERAVRAAGTSTGRNPVAIIIPCHRVMGKSGGLCGFGGGLDKKRFLLKLEKIDLL
ncbi:MAG TPA: methylated-DNA--[protein]-cysteine S-methyltransferase [Verrucomicrobiae bacterium]|jgi:methylated-DNA-[protein]-cysteine S-methyltransferase|nr:methylated-DNA--[protein]-cysteine S-methyltransferase [Verrucomicrobiae bacterium]